MGRARNNLFLVVDVQIDKVVAVPGHAHQQIAIFSGSGLGLAQGLGINHIKLNMMPVELKNRIE